MLVNLTPHSVHLHPEGGDPIVIPPSGVVARVAQERRVVGRVPVGIGSTDCEIGVSDFGKIVDLPSPQPGTWYIVSALVLAAAPARDDLLVPSRTLRDGEGRIVGCAAFDTNAAGAQRLTAMLKAAPTPASAAEAEPAPVPESEVVTEPASKSVVLYDAGGRRIDVIRAILDAGEGVLELHDALRIVRTAEYRPVLVLDSLSQAEAEALVKRLVGLGAEAKIIPDGAEIPAPGMSRLVISAETTTEKITAIKALTPVGIELKMAKAIVEGEDEILFSRDNSSFLVEVLARAGIKAEAIDVE